MRNPCVKLGLTAAMAVAMAPMAHAGNVSNGNKQAVTLGGYVDKAMLWADDGTNSRFMVVDNENLSTRFFISGEGKVNEMVSMGFYFENEIRGNSSADVSLDDGSAGARAKGGSGAGDSGVGSTTFTERSAEVFMKHEKFGKITLGVGAMASDGSAEADTSGTGIIAYSGVSDMGGSIKFRRSNGTYGPTVGTVSSNMDGLSRDDRVRYDTPTFGGFGLAVSAASGGNADIGGTFSGKFASVAISAAAAYWNQAGTSTTTDHGLSGSISAKHDSGIGLTFATAKTNLKSGNTNPDPTFYYGKLSYSVGLMSLGETSFSVDYGKYDDVAQRSDEMKSIGVAIVQDVASAGASLYVAYRNNALDRTGTSFEDVNIVMAGASVAF